MSLLLLLIQIGMFLSYCECGDTKKVVHISPELIGKIAVAVQKCQPETGINAEAIIMLYDGKFREDQQFKDFIFCCYKTTGFLHKDGSLDQDKAIKALNKEPIVENGIKRCASERGDNPKETLFKFFKCFTNTVPVKITV